MPYAEILTTKNLISEKEKNDLAKKMTKILLDAEGLIDNPMSRSIALLEIKEFDCLYVGGEKGDKEKILIKIYSFSNAFDEESKKKIFSDITEMLISISDKVRSQEGRNVWCMIMPLDKFDFGVGGAPVTLEMTRNLVSSYDQG